MRLLGAGGEVRAVLQIVHGISEYVERYGAFAAFLNDNGVLVVGEDHMGHGKSVEAEGCLGCFYGGWTAAVDDSYALMERTMAEHPDVPYILLGHSMGSFLARTLLHRYPNSGIAGAVLSGTGWQPQALLAAGSAAAGIMICAHGEEAPSPLLDRLMFGGYNRGYGTVRTAFDWLTGDPTVVDAYIKDPLCGFPASAGLVRDLMTGLKMNQSRKNLEKMKKDLPVLFIAGGQDPVGAWGKGVRKTAAAFLQAGMQRLETRIYEGGRHEILNEINKQEVYGDVLNWMQREILR